MRLLDALYFIPTYDVAGNNVTEVVFSNGETQILNLTLRKCIIQLLDERDLDRKSLKKWTYKIIQAKHNTPLTLSENIIFIPVKIRIGAIPADGCMGYVLWSAIRKVTDYKLYLQDNIVLETRSSAAYVSKKIGHCRNLKCAYTLYKKKFEFMSMDIEPFDEGIL